METHCLTVKATVGKQLLRQDFCGPTRFQDYDGWSFNLTLKAKDGEVAQFRVYDHRLFWDRVRLKLGL